VLRIHSGEGLAGSDWCARISDRGRFCFLAKMGILGIELSVKLRLEAGGSVPGDLIEINIPEMINESNDPLTKYRRKWPAWKIMSLGTNAFSQIL